VKVEGRLNERVSGVRVGPRSFENRTKRGQDHQEALPQGGGDLPIVELAHTSEIPFCEVQTNLFPGLSHS